MKTLAAALVGLVATTEAFGQEAGIRPQAPVIVHSIDGTGPCGTGIVRGLDPSGDGFLQGRARAAIRPHRQALQRRGGGDLRSRWRLAWGRLHTATLGQQRVQ
jgi:hypothetical protein